MPVRVWPRAPITLTVQQQHSGWATTERTTMPRKKSVKPAAEGAPIKTETVEEYLARGGKITICNPMERSDEVNYKFTYGKKKKKKEEE